MAVSTKAIKLRIKSVSNTKKITKAMEMVAASKMRKAVEKSLAGKEYAKLALELLVNISKNKIIKHPLLRKTNVKKELIVVISSNKGLCGGYNINIYKSLKKYIDKNKNKEISVISVGRYAERYAKKLNLPVIASFIDFSDNPQIESLSGLTKLVIDEFVKEKFDKVSMLFTNYISAINSEVINRGLLPISQDNIHDMIKDINDTQGKEIKQENMSLYLFEPDEDEVLIKILPTLTEVQIYQAILDSFAAEHSARMIAMRNASDSADDMVKELTLFFNKARQAAITQEIAEIATGAQALQS